MVEEGGLTVNPMMAFLLKNSYTKNIARVFLLTRALDMYKKAAFDESFEIWQAGKGVNAIESIGMSCCNCG